MASADPNYNFDCPECEERLSVSREKIGNHIHCNLCGENIHVPSPMSTTDKLIAGMLDDDDFEHPGSLKIDGITDDADDGSSWHIKCHICDSTLLVTSQQVGKKIKCNDCYSMLDVLPNADAAKLAADVKDGSDLEIVADAAPNIPSAIPPSPDEIESLDDSGELTLAPAPDLSPAITDAKKETFLDELVEDDSADDAIELSEPIAVSSVAPNFGLEAPADAESDDDDSDEMIEMLDVAPEELNRTPATTSAAPVASTPTELPRMPRKKGKQPNSIPVQSDEEEKPIRVHAKRRAKPVKPTKPERKKTGKGLVFEEASLNEVLDKAMGFLKTGNIWIWSLISIAIMAIGSSIWHGLSPHRMDPETITLASKLVGWGAGLVFGLGIYFVGYVLLLFVCGVIFRETAQGNTTVEAVSVSNSADFTSTMLLFGFSMTIAALPCALFGFMWISLPVQFLLAGCFLFAAWENQGAFSIVSGNIFRSFSEHSGSWKKWFVGAAIAMGGGLFGGLLLEVYLPVISIFTSIAGSIIVTLSTLLYAAITGWHCGSVVEQMNRTDEQ